MRVICNITHPPDVKPHEFVGVDDSDEAEMSEFLFKCVRCGMLARPWGSVRPEYADCDEQIARQVTDE